MHYLVYASAVLAASAYAAPTEKRAPDVTGPVAQGIWANGRLIRGGNNPTATSSDGSDCTEKDDVMQCATKIAATWTVGTSAAPNARTLRVPCTINDDQNGHHGGCYFDAPISVAYDNCKISNPTIISQDTLIDCNDDCKLIPVGTVNKAKLIHETACAEKFTFSTSTTDTHTFSYDLKTSVTAGVNFDFFSAQVNVEGDWSNGWSESTTNTTTIERDWNMKKGERCAATTIQFGVACDATISGITPAPGNWVNRIYDTFGNSMGDYWVCNDPRISGPAVDQMCKARANPTVPVNVDLGNGAVNSAPYTIEGCMFK